MSRCLLCESVNIGRELEGTSSKHSILKLPKYPKRQIYAKSLSFYGGNFSFFLGSSAGARSVLWVSRFNFTTEFLHSFTSFLALSTTLKVSFLLSPSLSLSLPHFVVVSLGWKLCGAFLCVFHELEEYEYDETHCSNKYVWDVACLKFLCEDWRVVNEWRINEKLPK